ncbi:YafY family protein [Bacillus sp. 03113]|uniref:helix-turn-helix transcriptional regulator n=1 Tax=Bacillus sp. 03113 TaxID=2578211 RepID=UPI0011429034|nr:YafY family protein [Bacillus sp. 03113]
MQINRLFEIVYLLLNKKTITAKQLAEQFEVSIRTIYRDVDTLSAAGIPIYTNRGKGGGISLIDDFILNKSIFSEKEQNEILIGLQSLSAVKFPEIESVLTKLSLIFNKQGKNWIEVDFSNWGSDDREREKFNLLREAILNKTVVAFDYFNAYGEKMERMVEPLKLLYKGRSWYFHGFCRVKNDFRIFKITRVKNLSQLDETFEGEPPDDIWDDLESRSARKVTLVVRFDERIAYRLYDELDPACIQRNEDGSFTAMITFPEDEWVYGYILSYGPDAEVLEPKHIREIIKRKLEESLQKYL